MLRLHIVRNRQALGEFTPSEVAEGLQTGKFLPTDLAWREPMDTWMTLGDLDTLPTVASKPMIPVLPHLEGEIVPEPEPAIVGGIEPAWERKSEVGFMRAVTETIRQVCVTPTDTFRELKTEGGYGTPLMFFVLVATICGWVASGYDLAAIMFNPEAITKNFGPSITPALMIGSSIATIVLTPVLMVIKAFLAAALFHGVLLASGGASKGYEATFRAYCYAAGAASVALLIPTLIGRLIAVAMGILFLVIALREVHRVAMFRAAMAVVPVVIVAFALLIGFYVLVFAAAGIGGLK